MKAIFEFFESVVNIEFLLFLFIIILLGWIVIAWQDYREQKDIAKRLEKENELFGKKYGHKK